MSTVTIEPTKMGESKFNSNKFDWSNTMFLAIQEKCDCSSGYPEFNIKRKTYKRIPTNGYNCDKSNQKKSFDCINTFLASERSVFVF